MEKLWAGRAHAALDKAADDFNSSIAVDSRMYRQDIRGSMAHAAMLAKAGMISAFVDKTQEHVTGKVKLCLYKGNVIKAGAWSDWSLYSEEIATFGEDHVYDQADSKGFINLFGLPIKVQAQVDAKIGRAHV